MAKPGAERTPEPSPQGKASKKSGKTKATKSPKLWLRSAGHTRTERKFAPKTSASAVVGVLGASLGAVSVGAGVYGQFLSTPPHGYAPYLIGGGGLLALVSVFFGGRPSSILVGDLGVGIEKDPETIERLPWYDVDNVRFAANTLSFSGKGRVISLSTATHPEAVALAIKEARSRIPAHMADFTETMPAPHDTAGESLTREPLQLAGLRCKASDRIIAVDKDGRYCGKCGQTYHREEVPDHCLSCDALLV